MGLKCTSIKEECGFFLRNSLSLRAMDYISKSINESDCEFEALWLEIVNNTGKTLLIGVVYKHPSKNFTPCLDYIQSVFTKIHRENKFVVLSGDFNLNVLKHDKIPKAETFINLMLANFYNPLVTFPREIEKQVQRCFSFGNLNSTDFKTKIILISILIICTH